jgi:hypothetical protein
MLDRSPHGNPTFVSKPAFRVAGGTALAGEYARASWIARMTMGTARIAEHLGVGGSRKIFRAEELMFLTPPVEVVGDRNA